MKLSELIIYDDKDFVALNKPPGMLSIPDREGKEISLKTLLLDHYDNIFTVHRIDKDTSGLIIFAKNEQMHRHLCMQFEERQTKKIYVGLILGSPAVPSGTIDLPIAENMVSKGTMIINRKGKAAITDFTILETFGRFTHLQFRIHTGRTHQIRVHMAHAGHPILCDPLYGDGKAVMLSDFKKKFNLSKSEWEERPLLARLALHAIKLVFSDSKGNVYTPEAPLPKDLRALLQQATKNLKKD